jgi:type IV secretory pathway VirB10-like protein
MKRLISIALIAMIVLLVAGSAVSASEKSASTPEKTKEEVKKVEPAPAEKKTEGAAPPAESKNVTPPATKPPTPGFEGIFAITGLLAVAYLVLGRER